MRWISVDPATRTGVARWEDDRLLGVATMRPATPKERKGHAVNAVAVEQHDGARPVILPNRSVFWVFELIGKGAVVIEEAMGFQPKTVAQLGYRRGYIAALAEARGVSVLEVNTSSWRKVCGEAWGVSFPAKSDAAKELSIALVREHYGVECTDDEADAVLVGFWGLRTRQVWP